MWVGTRNGGLVALDLHGWSSLGKSLGLPSNEVTAILPTQDDHGSQELWVGTSKGLAHWQKGAWQLHTLDPKAPDYINSLLETREGDKRVLWVGTLKGLVRHEGDRWERLDPKRSTGDPQIFRVRQGTAPHGEQVLWAGTQWGLAALRKGVWSVQTRADGLPHDWVFDLIETACPDGEKDVWVGTRGGGIGRFHQGRWEDSRNGLTYPGEKVVTCLLEVPAPDGTRWLFAGSQGMGLLRLSLDHPEQPWTVFTGEPLPGLVEQGITSLALDGKGRLFIGTPKCVMRIKIGPGGSIGEKVVYTEADGLPSLSTAIGALSLSPDGQMWVGTAKGLATIDPNARELSQAVPRPLVDWVDRAGNIRPWQEGLRLSHLDNRLMLRLSLPLYHHFEEVQFRTQILAMENAPSPWSKEALWEFPFLPSGRHTLRIWGRDHLGRESQPVDLQFQVQTPPWRHPWALLLYALLLGGLLWGLLSLRVRWLTRRNRLLNEEIRQATSALEAAKLELEDRVRERTHELGDALARATAADRAKASFLARMSHELRTPLNQMVLIAQLVQEDWKEATGRESSPDVEAILVSGRTLEGLISDLLDFSNLEEGNLRLELAPFEPAALLAEIRALYGPLARAKGLRFEVSTPSSLPPFLVGDRKRLGQVLKDLVSNAIKFSDRGYVELRVRAESQPGALRIEVDDTGPGIKPEARQRIFEPFEQGDGDLSRRHGGTGLGLAIAKRILSLMNGRIGLEPLPTGGTRFWVEVSLAIPPVAGPAA